MPTKAILYILVLCGPSGFLRIVCTPPSGLASTAKEYLGGASRNSLDTVERDDVLLLPLDEEDALLLDRPRLQHFIHTPIRAAVRIELPTMQMPTMEGRCIVTSARNQTCI